ncbi:cobalamin-independent methionine synthase II family protein [Texcoconibacillus texcoconensis]|uniref:5-methyltetrahydropteroyltriglutamate--homocysteine methyltransferase n=1 Tax=Texcoconibacillus texcoconensis TaxID=1095777 RepID=A0A840QPR5_9BACI|nr:cobalamin-independent methionine synthase II family protein [Texcoconibacillus texcoconensis]MBB5173365.1 5-methyltetrahydropteroyltriglutamate--homocysteine methyltransferase [Texcoconibacillus texcoconensis]
MTSPFLTTTTVGSWPRSREVLNGLRDKRAGRITEEQFNEIADQAVVECIKHQEASGIDMITDGEQRRDNFISFVADKINNVDMLSISDLLKYVEDKASFEEILGTLDIPAYSLTNPAATGKISRKNPIAVDEYAFIKKHTDKPVKVAIPGPYLLARSMWVEGLSANAYPTKEDLAEDIVKVLREEIEDLIASGVPFIQMDEPVLTELVFTQKNANRTFMCGALTAKADANEELDFAMELINKVTEGMLGRGSKIGLHICRGNWSTQEDTLLKGPYDPLMPHLAKLNLDQLVLEFATPRAGELQALEVFKDTEIEVGLGVVNPRVPEVETVDEIVDRVKEAAQYIPLNRLFLNPDCGFGTFAQKPMNTSEIATKKLANINKAAEILKSEPVK